MRRYLPEVVADGKLELLNELAADDMTDHDRAARLTRRKIAMSEETKALAARWTEEIWNKGNEAAIGPLVSADLVFHMPSAPDLRGHGGLKEFLRAFRGAFPDGRFAIDEAIAAGDKVVLRWTLTGTHKGEYLGVPATGKRTTSTGTTTLRIAAGKVAEHWVHWDATGWLAQVGRAPA
jgi:steroid delta-isomerase-like uncharacterized protein